MKANRRRYVRKLPKSGGHLTSLSLLLDWLEALNGIEWRELLHDIVCEDDVVRTHVGVPPSEGVLSYLVGFLRRTNGRTTALISLALSQEISELRKHSSSEEYLLSNALYLARALQLDIDANLLKTIIGAPDVGAATRASAAMTLATMRRVPEPDYWMSDLDLERHPELMPAALHALSQAVPSEALLILNRWEENRLSNLAALRRAVKRFVEVVPSHEEIKQVANELSRWACNLVADLTEDKLISTIFREMASLKLAITAPRADILPVSRGSTSTAEGPCLQEIAATKVIQYMLPTYLPAPYLFRFRGLDVPRRPNPISDYYIERIKYYSTEAIQAPVNLKELPPPAHDFQYLISRICFSSQTPKKNRIALPLEFMFDHRERSQIEVMPLFMVTHFAMVYHENLPIREMGYGTEEWLQEAASTKIENRPISLCAHSNNIVDYILKDAVAQGILLSDQIDNRQTIGALANWLHANYGKGVVACDVGLGLQIQEYIKTENIPLRTQISHINYDIPIPVGLCFRRDDLRWGEICRQAFDDTVAEIGLSLSTSWQELVDLATLLSLKPFIGPRKR